MPDWLFEGRTNVYVILAALTGLLVLVWWQTRKRWCLIAAVVMAGLIGIYAILNVAVETDREQIVRKVNEMTAAVNAHKLDAAFVHISDQFRSHGGKTKQELRTAGQTYLEQKIVERVDVWDIGIEGQPSREKREVHVRFSVKVHGGQEFFTDCDALFAFEPEHGWRMKGFRLLKPQTNEEWSWQI
ncbi:MAG TPA: hypothetical protein VN688_28650 [Gemmataceae bacterium]|nr:hypothetical protein [Gemmataceae bacterium]